MNSAILPLVKPGSLTGAILVYTILVSTLRAAPSAPSEKPTPRAPVVEESAIPQSIYVVPANAKQGRDPFFPNSVRLQAKAVVPSGPVTPRVTLGLNGLGGTSEKKLAIVNGHTFAEGESAEVNTSSGRILIRCVEIKEKSVVVEVGNERRELFLRSGN